MAETNRLKFRIPDMDCMEEVAILRRGLRDIVGGEDRLAFDVLQRQMIVAAPLEASQVIQAVSTLGMTAELVDTGSRVNSIHDRAGFDLSQWLTLASGLSLLLGIAIGSTGASALSVPSIAIERFFYGIAVIAGFWIVVPKAIRAALRLQPDMNLLMTIAVSGAMVIGEFAEAASVAFLFALSHVLESWSVGRAQRAISALLQLAPPTARVLDAGGQAQMVPVEEVELGTQIFVHPGERVPLDGTVIRGQSALNQAPITGESMPTEKASGDAVFAGSINGNGALELTVTKTAGNSTIANIIRLVEQARSQRSKSEQWVDHFARIYTPLVMLAALLTFLIPPVLLGVSWSDSLYRSLVLLVIACPCALVISTPVAVVAALAAAASSGVLVKGGGVLESLAHIKAIAIDKTGTLTEGKPRLQSIYPLDGHDETELLARAAGLNARSGHPLAIAIMEEALKQKVPINPAEDFLELPGRGAQGTWSGKHFWIGSARLYEERNLRSPEAQVKIEQLAAAGQTVVVVGNAKHVCGVLGLADSVRPSAHEALEELKALWIGHVQMLTGDAPATAKSVAESLALDGFSAGLLPADKVSEMKKLVTRFGHVAMVGDGVNDAPALAIADVGIAMGVAGSDAAIETADVALMSNDLTRLPWLIKHARRMLSIIKQNIAFSLIVKAIFVFLTMVGVSSLWGAIAADTGASLLVIFNGLRLLQVHRTTAEPAIFKTV